jgi:hypothetical protein
MPSQGQVVASMGAYVALIESQQQALKNRLDLVAPEAGGAAVIGGNLDMNSNSITEAKNVTAENVIWTKATPAVYGQKYAGGAAGSALANSTTATSLLPATATGTLVWALNKWTAYSSIRFRAGMVIGVTGTPTLTLRLLLNGTAITTHVLSPTTGADAEIDVEFMVTSSTNAMLTSKSTVNGIATVVDTNAAVTIDTTIENTLTFTGQWSAASASNTVTLGFVKCDYLQA